MVISHPLCVCISGCFSSESITVSVSQATLLKARKKKKCCSSYKVSLDYAYDIVSLEGIVNL